MKKNTICKIAIILIFMLFIDITMPILTVQAGFLDAVLVDVALGVFEAIASWLVELGDLVIEGLQKIFMGYGKIDIDVGESKNVYFIQYSPGIIFSGNVPALDVNFIKPKENFQINPLMAGEVIETNVLIENQKGDGPEGHNTSKDASDILYNFMKINYNEYMELYDTAMASFNSYDYNGGGGSQNGSFTSYIGTYIWMNIYEEGNNKRIHKNKLTVKWDRKTTLGQNYQVDSITSEIYITLTEEISSVDNSIVPISSAKEIRDTIATWYRVMRNIALVGLLSVLVYVAIRMILSSAAQDKAKYKKMIEGWFTAICILFLLHFIMALTFTVTQKINDVFKGSVIGENSEDILMSGIRYNIEMVGIKTVAAFANEVIYIVLIILTVMYTVQYMKRFIYIAFLVMISPLIALTYPLDKIKDGQAQAFTMWLREFIFSVLIQPVHLIVYYILLGIAKDELLNINSIAYNPVYAIVAISFLLPAEKFIRKMFGFEKAEATNVMGSALGGAAVMNAINKLGSKGPKGKTGAQGNGNTGENKVRTANEDAGDPYEALRNGANPQQPAPQPNPGPNPQPAPQPSPGPNPQPAPQLNPGPNPQQGPQQGQQPAPQPRNIKNKPSRWKGAWKLARTYALNGKVVKGAIKGAAKVTGAAALGTIGLAAGIATGDFEKAFSGAAIGLTAGSKLGGNLVEGGANLVSGVADAGRGIKNTYREGKYGEDEAARMKFDDEFKKSKEYKSLMKNYPGQEDTAQEFLNAGITDTKQMGNAMKGIEEGKYDAKEAIAYMKMAEKCPDGILYDEAKFKKYLTDYGIDESRAADIRKKILDFK